MRQWYEKFIPKASNPALLLTASTVWTLIGIFLAARGMGFLTPGKRWLALIAVFVGTGKSLLILDRTALKNARRIEELTGKVFITAIYPAKIWGLILLMILMGRLLRASSLPGNLVGVIYIAIGWALFLSSRTLWRQWFNRAGCNPSRGKR